ncbi:MAG: hypothetical protein ABWX67_03255 [Allosphingosinicella sp.]
MKRLAALIALVAAAGAGGPAAAQMGARWATGDTAITTLGFGGADPPPVRADRSTEDMARLFKTACLDTGGRTEAIDAAVADGRLALVGINFTVTATKKRPELKLRLWRGPGIVIARTDGFSDVREAQCSASFHPLTHPTSMALTEGMTKVLGAPSNAAEATGKNGKRAKRYVPIWTLSDGAGAPVIVNGIAMRGGRFTADSVLMAARAAATAVR